MVREDPILVQITGANTNDSKLAVEMLNLLNHKEVYRFVGYKAYDTNKIRQELYNMDN